MLLERFVNGRARSNAYVYAPVNEQALIVDAGMGAAAKIIDLVAAEGLTPQAVVLTHGHPDHIWTARELSDRFEVPAYIHRDDESWFIDPATGTRLPFARLAGRAIARGRRLRPSRLEVIKEGQLIAGSFDLNVIHVPGHSAGSVLLRTDELCFAGDTVFKGSVGAAVYPGGDKQALRRSIERKLLPLPDDVRLMPGHGKETCVGAERAGWMDYLGRV